MGSTFDVDQQNLLLLFCLIATRSSNALAVPLENTDTMDQRPCEVGHQGCTGLPFPDLNWRRHAVEPRTGIEADIDMTVRLVVSCNGMKINTVRDAFEKSLRARLVKTNPETDFHCITTFGSNFTQDIPLPAGTTIDFQRTADGKLITKIEGNQIGAVHSKDLCRAFFDMYLGDLPVSEQSKEEIGRNVANIIRRC
ncbi:hypothetical protein GBA52_028344 [Prunus armeniaca]|nr:hypothetical protein GBA52_028344 [Prunus armeniaca]